MTVTELQSLSQKLADNVAKRIIGKDEVIKKVIISLFCGGHILLEDIPGTGKTTLAKALAKSIGCDFKRVQFTPDLLPSDLTGLTFYSQKESEFVFKKGAIFTNILLGDEINRATPKTQSSLLECMEERQVTVDGVTHSLKAPFLVVATQNPVEIRGTFPLPEAQLDRFFMQLSVGYPDNDCEVAMLQSNIEKVRHEELKTVATDSEIIEAQAFVNKISVSDDVLRYIVDIVDATRSDDRLRLGASPRGSIALMRAAQGAAAVSGRDYVIPDDVKYIAKDVLSHRIILKGLAFSENTLAGHELIEEILSSVSVPLEARG